MLQDVPSGSSSNMADLSRIEKLASARKRLKQFQQKNRDSQSESGRSTPSKKKLEDEEEGSTKIFQSENGGSLYSLSHSENPSSNISGTDSPVPVLEHGEDSISQMLNGNSQPDILSVSSVFSSLPKVSESFFQNPSPSSFFMEPVPPANTQSGSDFFDNLSSGNDPQDETPQRMGSGQELSSALLNVGMCQLHTSISASTPQTNFAETTSFSFPDLSTSSISEGNAHSTSAFDEKHSAKNAELVQVVTEQENRIAQLQLQLEDVKMKADEQAATLKHHVHAIEILVSEKTELQNALDKRQEQIDCKTGEVEELQSRLRASRHRVSELEREINTIRSHLQSLECSHRDLSAQHGILLDQSDSLRKRVGDFEVEVSDLRSKLESRDEALNTLRGELENKTSQMSLAEVRIQQLSGGPESGKNMEEELRCKNEELSKTVKSLESQMSAAVASNEESVKEYQQYVNRLHTEFQELKTVLEASNEQVKELTTREQQLVQQVSELERQLNKIPQPQEDPALRTLREQLRLAEETSQNLKNQLQQKASEVECLREGLQERAFRIQELETTVERLETDRPDTANLQAAIESDKVAASRAVAQNNTLKKQLEELQDAVVKLSNNKLELTQQLQHEQHLSRDLTEKLERIQESKTKEVESAQQTESPALRETESQTTNSQPVVSPEAMAKLEEKFRKTMSELADLSDEKQRLEHLVLQLQSETETIGEYITLYQIQRGMLRQRAQEKDEQVAKLAQDKEALRNKLAQLNCLVQRLVGGGHQPQLNVDESVAASETEETSSPPVLPDQSTSDNVETAEQIRSLLSEIGSNNLVTSTGDNTNINFHPCPWCSGRLITV